MNFDELVRSQKKHFSVIPAKAGIQDFQGLLDPGFRRGDGLECLLRIHQFWFTCDEIVTASPSYRLSTAVSPAAAAAK